MFKKVFFTFIFAFPFVVQAAPKHSSTTMSVDYENIQQLIKNYYAAHEFCRSSTKEYEDPETRIMCNYRDAADAKLNKLGWCFGHDGQSEAEKQWEKCKGKK